MNHNHWPQELSKGIFHVHVFQWKKTFHNRGPKNKFIIEDQAPSWSTTLKICLGAMFYKGFNWVQKEGGGVQVDRVQKEFNP